MIRKSLNLIRLANERNKLSKEINFHERKSLYLLLAKIEKINFCLWSDILRSPMQKDSVSEQVHFCAWPSFAVPRGASQAPATALPAAGGGV